jgi:putative oxidoreductase
MKSKLWLVNLGFIPRSYDLALLFLRLSLGLSIIVLHGWDKLTNYRTMVDTFPDPLHAGRHASLVLALFAELVCGGLLVVGALTRFAAAVLIIMLSVAFFMVHHGEMSQGELAALYLFGFTAILLAGGGRFSADGAGGPWALAAFGAVAGAAIGYPASYLLQPEHPLTQSLGEYISSIRSVLHDDSLHGRAVAVWIASVAVLAVAGWLVGRAMYRNRPRVVEVEKVSPPPPAA